jgi:hypothetical protein
MYVSKFLLNRQKIFDPIGISAAIESHFGGRSKPGKDYIYRLEWYKIGVSVPVIVYSSNMPKMRVNKEFQLLETRKASPIKTSEDNTAKFSIFLVPDFIDYFEPDTDFEKISNWFSKKLENAGKILEVDHGPDNCIFYRQNQKEHKQQTITLKGKIEIKNSDRLEQLCSKPVGTRADLGCGLLYLA